MIKLNVGCSYLATQEACRFEFEGVEHVFDKVEKKVKILDKPTRIFLADSIPPKEADLPKHLQSEDWYFVENLQTSTTQWFSPIHYDVKLLN